MFENKVILITGGTGSFGNAVVKQLIKTNIKEIRIFSRDEDKQDKMRRMCASEKMSFYIGDVRDYNSVFEATRNVNFIFSAAALKQVPSCEFFPVEAIKTNALGTENVLNAAVAQGVERVVVLSTDKAVYPVSAMGMSKALMEKIMTAKARLRGPVPPIFSGTRYGNVMATRGSVIPLFIEQIKAGRDITITDPDMTRFLMSIDNAVDLVVFAFTEGRSGDIFVQKSPACTLQVLAQAMLEIFHAPNKIQTIGIRHGEKLHETLLTREEMVKAEDLGDYYRIPADTRDLNYDKYFVNGEEQISRGWEYTSENTKRLDVNGVKELLLKLDFIQEELASWKQSR